MIYVPNILPLDPFLVSSNGLHLLTVSVFALCLDCYNSLFTDLHNHPLGKPQRACILFCEWKTDHATSLLYQLHWLPVCAHNDYKITILIYCCFITLPQNIWTTNALPPKVISSVCLYFPPLCSPVSDGRNSEDASFTAQAHCLQFSFPFYLNCVYLINHLF